MVTGLALNLGSGQPERRWVLTGEEACKFPTVSCLAKIPVTFPLLTESSAD